MVLAHDASYHGNHSPALVSLPPNHAGYLAAGSAVVATGLLVYRFFRSGSAAASASSAAAATTG